jgi:hypothetical protein
LWRQGRTYGRAYGPLARKHSLSPVPPAGTLAQARHFAIPTVLARSRAARGRYAFLMGCSPWMGTTQHTVEVTARADE